MDPGGIGFLAQTKPNARLFTTNFSDFRGQSH